MAMTESAERMFQNFIDIAQENEECPLCERRICGNPLTEFIAKVSILILFFLGHERF